MRKLMMLGLAILTMSMPIAASAQNVDSYVDSGGRRASAKTNQGLPVSVAPPNTPWSYAAATSGIAASTTAVTIKAAAGAGLRNYISSLQIQTATLGNATELAIRDGAAGTVLWRTQLQTTALPVVTINFPSPLKGTANTLLEVVTLTSATGGVYVNAQGFVAP